MENIELMKDNAEIIRCIKCVYSNDNGTVCHYGVGKNTKPNGFCHNGENYEEQ